MVVIQDQIISILRSRQFGIYPTSITTDNSGQIDTNEFANHNSKQDTFIKALDIERRTLLFMNEAATSKNTSSEISQLIKEATSVSVADTTEESVTQLVLSVTLGQLYYQSGEYEKGIEILSSIKLEESEFSYVTALYYKTYYLIASCYEKLNSFEHVKSALLTGVNLCNKLPLASEVESSTWLLKLFDLVRLYILKELKNVNEIKGVFKKNANFVVYYLNYMGNEAGFIDGTESFIKTRAGLLLSSVQFPESKLSNSYEMEEYLECFADSNLKNLIPLSTLMDLLEQGISKTYHSLKLLKSYVKVLLKTENKDAELEASLDVFITYVENYNHLNSGLYYDILSALDLFHFVISKGTILKRFDYFLEKFKGVLLDFYKIHGIDTNHSQHNLDYFLNAELKLKLSKYWYSIGISNLLQLNSSSLIEEGNLDYDSIIVAFENSISLDPADKKVRFDYILNLTQFRKVKDAYKLLKGSLKTLTPGTELYFRSLHLLVLILSIEDNKDEAHKISSFLDSEIEQLIANTQPSTIDLKLRERFVDIKITHLAVIEAFYGVDQALDSLKELFILFNDLFSDVIIPDDEEEEDAEDEEEEDDYVEVDSVNPGGVTSNIRTVKSHRKSLSLAKQQTLTKIKSITRYRKQSKQAPATQTSKHLKIEKDHSTECKILQKIWLVSSQIYYRMSMFKESEESLLEAETCYRPTDETHFQLSLLLSQGSRHKLAFEQVEQGLSSNRNSIPCIVGLANLILNQSPTESQSDSVFLTDKDHLAAVARAKLLLEESSKTFRGFHTSEIWLLLSQIYEKFGDSKRLQSALWRVVAFEESRALRDFSVV